MTKKDLEVEVLDAEEVSKQSTKQTTKYPTSKTGRDKQRLSRVKRDIQIVTLAKKGLKKSEIAKAVGITPGTVNQVLSKFRPVFEELENVQEYSQARKELLNAAELTLLKSTVDPLAIAKAPLGNRAYAFKQIHDARRLEEGKSTQNIESHTRFTKVNLSDIADDD